MVAAPRQISVMRGTNLFALAAAVLFLGVAILAITAAAVPADDTPPVLRLIDSEGKTLRNGTVFHSDDITIECLAMDDISEIEDVEYSIDGSTFKPTTNDGDIHRTSVNLNGLSDGEHSITVRATNNASLTSEEAVDFTIDQSAAPSENLLIWNIIGAIVAISGILIAFVLIILERGREPRREVPLLREGEMPPIL